MYYLSFLGEAVKLIDQGVKIKEKRKTLKTKIGIRDIKQKKNKIGKNFLKKIWWMIYYMIFKRQKKYVYKYEFTFYLFIYLIAFIYLTKKFMNEQQLSSVLDLTYD